MNNKYISRFAVLALVLFASCNKFLDVVPKGIVIPKNTSEYEGMLNSLVMTQTFSPELLYMTDDTYMVVDPTSTSTLTNAYCWREFINAEDKNSPAIWGNLYNTIYFSNVIINEVLAAQDTGAVAKKQQVYAEALLIRAYCYMDLLTVFARSWDPASAATDPGLPLMTSIDVGDKTPARSSVQATLDTMISNVLQAAELLPATNINRYRATKYAAFGMLSRMYLYKADFDNAGKYAELALAAPHSLLNYNDYTGTDASDGFPLPDNNPEILWLRNSSDYSIPFQVLYSADLQSYYNGTSDFESNPDLRYRYLSVGTNAGVSRNKPNGSYMNFGITFQEMDLTRAEVMARKGGTDDAVDIVNTIRKNRINTADYADLTANDPEEALKIVLAERRRELAFAGMRWFDMKRLDQEGRMSIVRRINPAVGATPATQVDSLPPGSPKYTYQIPSRVIQFNPDMILNER